MNQYVSSLKTRNSHTDIIQCAAFVKNYSSACADIANIVETCADLGNVQSSVHTHALDPTALQRVDSALQALTEDMKSIKQQLSVPNMHLQYNGNVNTAELLQQLPLPAMTPAPNSTNKSAQRVLNINGTIIHFTDKDLPVIPGIAFSANLKELFRIWDNPSCAYLTLKGVNVPPLYWGELYARQKAQNWSRMKGKWMNWHVCDIPDCLVAQFYESTNHQNIMNERCRYSTDEAFWAVWSEHDDQSGEMVPMTQTQILLVMTKDCTDREKANSDCA